MKQSGPRVHQVETLLQQIPAPIRRLDFVADGMRKRHLDNLARIVRPLGGPIAEGRPEAMRGQIASAHSAQQHEKRHVGERAAGFAPGNTKAAPYPLLFDDNPLRR